MNEQIRSLIKLTAQELTDRPAISREDNQTEICPSCGIREAMETFEKHEH